MSAPAAVSAARLAFDANGVPRSLDFEDVYHSADGGPEQASHVFLAGNELPAGWRARPSFTILETGFGLGLNFLCTASALCADGAAPRRLHYVAVEKHPPLVSDLARAHAHWPALGTVATELRAAWPPLLTGFHRIELAAGRIVLTLLFGEAAAMLAELDARADAIYLDGFAPAKNAAMWSDAVFGHIARLSAPGTRAATWTVATAVRARLEAAGFAVSKRPGFGRKREMLAAVRPGRPAATRAGGHHAVVIGAGLAGSWLAHALSHRGFDVELIERHRKPAQEASGNAVGVVRPVINRADTTNARLARAAFLHAARLLSQLASPGVHARCGVLHVATTAVEADRIARIAAEQRLPADYARFVETPEACGLAGRPVAGPGWWIPAGGWAAPRTLCEILLARMGSRARTRFGTHVHALERRAGGWRLLDACGNVLTEAPIVIVASGFSSLPFGLPQLPLLTPVRGQVTFLPPAHGRRLDIVVGGDGYIAPLPQGGHCTGATFEPGSSEPGLRTADHSENLARAQRMLPGFAAGLDGASLAGWAGIRTATSDRLPACGALKWVPDSEGCRGLYLATGLGARGLIWAPLCAEALAAALNGEPNPVETSLLAALNPQRPLSQPPATFGRGPD
jgi:tRNA 5-methylaminomethyl-2-thiouridine biosynthesis bifunctional protein